MGSPQHAHPQHRDHGREEAGAELRGTAAGAWKKPLRALGGSEPPPPPASGEGRSPPPSQTRQTSRERQLFSPDAIDTLSTS